MTKKEDKRGKKLYLCFLNMFNWLCYRQQLMHLKGSQIGWKKDIKINKLYWLLHLNVLFLYLIIVFLLQLKVYLKVWKIRYWKKKYAIAQILWYFYKMQIKNTKKTVIINFLKFQRFLIQNKYLWKENMY